MASADRKPLLSDSEVDPEEPRAPEETQRPENVAEVDGIQHVQEEQDSMQQVVLDIQANPGDQGPDKDDAPPDGLTESHLATIGYAICGLVTGSLMVLLVFLLPILCDSSQGGKDVPQPPLKCPLDSFSILVYSHALHWMVHLIVDQVLKKHHKASRCNGYIDFYIETKNLRRTPFYVLSFGNAVVLVSVIILDDYCGGHCEDVMLKVDWLRGMITLECLVIMAIWSRYISHVRRFNNSKLPPDVYREDVKREILCNRVLREDRNDEVADTEIRHVLRQRSSRGVPIVPTKDEILEKQAEILRYLQSHNEKQNALILRMNRQIELMQRDLENVRA